MVCQLLHLTLARSWLAVQQGNVYSSTHSYAWGASGPTSPVSVIMFIVDVLRAACLFYSEPRAVFSVLNILNSCKPRIKNCGMSWRRELNTNLLPGSHLSSAAIDPRKCGIRCSLTPSRVSLILNLNLSLRLVNVIRVPNLRTPSRERSDHRQWQLAKMSGLSCISDRYINANARIYYVSGLDHQTLHESNKTGKISG